MQTNLPLTLIPKKPAPTKESLTREQLDAEIAAYDARRKVEEAMVNFIARQMASPCVPHYDHVRQAQNMLRYLQEVATVTADVKKLTFYEHLKKEEDNA